MHKPRLAAAAILAALAAHAQTVLPAKSPYDRRGLYHATIRGRVVSPSGEPVPGVHLQLIAGRRRSLPLVDVVTGADGQFTISDLNSSYPPYLAWYPPEGWIQGDTSVAGESATEIDVGVIRLAPDTVIRVALELVGGAPVKAGNLPWVILQSKSEFGPRIVGERIGTEYVLRDITFNEGTWEVGIYTGSASESFTAPFRVQLGRRDQKLTFRLLRDHLVQSPEYELQGKMEVIESIVPVTPLDRKFTISGKVTGPDGTPVAGAILSNFGLSPPSAMPQLVRTGPDGSYHLTYTATKCIEPGVSYGDSSYWNTSLSRPSLRDVPCEEWLRNSPTIVMPTPTRLSILASGVDSSMVHADWWHDSLGWQRFSSLRPWVPAWGLWRPKIRVLADGYLPLTQPLTFPRFDPWKQQPPTGLALKFHFDSSIRRSLSILSSGRPVPGAVVDVESIDDLASDQRTFLGSFRLSADARLDLLGGATQIVEVFAYARGFEPTRAIWRPGDALVLNLSPRNSLFHFPPSSILKAARLRKAGSPRDVRTAFLNSNTPTRTPVVPGTYDITCYDVTGAVAGFRRVTVSSGDTITVDCSVDQRPRLTIRLPAPRWALSISESVPRGGATQWAAMLLVPNAPGFRDRDFTVLTESKTEATVALSHAGTWHIEAGAHGGTLSLWKEIDLQPGRAVTLTVPTTTGTLKGSMRTYGGGLTSAPHGFAGPRLQLIADDPTGWSATSFLPERDARQGEQRHNFTLTGIPVGSYHLYHHLIGKRQTYPFSREPVPYDTPIDAWGGIPVQVRLNAVTQLTDFSEYAFSTLQVRLTDAKGRAVEHATLRIRDRMSESWRQVQENPAQTEEANDPIPYPPAARIVNGRATLPNIRAGQLELLVELDTGPTYSFTVLVAPGRELQLHLPLNR